MQQQQILAELHLLQHASYYNSPVLEQFVANLNHHSGLVRAQNPHDHYCVFFLPVHRPTQQVYLGHHKKANLWIPPGAHIEPDESPRTTVKREVMEELQYEVHDKAFKLFDLSITHCTPGSACALHFDMWYLIEMDQLREFVFEEREFYDATWMPIKKALQITTNPDYKTILQSLEETLV